MMKKNLILLFAIMGILFISSAVAQPLTLGDIWSKVLDLGSLKFILGGQADNQLMGFIRIAIAIIIFAILYMGLSVIPHMSRNIAVTIGIILAIISAVFIPAQVLTLFGETYATIFAFIIIGAPLLGLALLLFATPTPNRGWALAKFLGVCFLIYLVNQIGYWATLLNATPF